MIVEIPAFLDASWNPWSWINVPVPDGATFVLTPDVIAQATEPGTRVEYDDHIFCLPANHVTIWLSRVDTIAPPRRIRLVFTSSELAAAALPLVRSLFQAAAR